MNIAKVKNKCIENGEGIRTSVFVQGCPIHCKNCHNPEQQSFEGGVPLTEEWIEDIIREVNESWCSGVSILGGEPLCKENMWDTFWLASKVKAATDKSVWVYTGYTFESLMKDQFSNFYRGSLFAIDVLVDGPYKDELRDPSLKFRGSSNQRILDFQKSYKEGVPVELKI